MPDRTLPAVADLASRARAVLEAHAQPEGYAVPHATTYPHQWLWDSCFHAIVWAALGESGRAVAELEAVFAHQGPDGFVPHMTYWSDPHHATDFWGRPTTSCVTQPPMFGHAIAELARRGIDVPPSLLEAASAAFDYLLGARVDGGAGGVRLVHPWESGCDDSPRWDAWCPSPWELGHWRRAKGELVEAIASPGPGGPVRSSAFSVEAAGFGALVAFNASELAIVTGDQHLAARARGLADVLAARWDHTLATWIDVDTDGSPTRSGRVRTLDALLGVLVVADDAQREVAFAQVADAAAFAAPFGPAGVHRHEPTFDPRTYWRGPAWPQLTYLLWVAASRDGRDGLAEELRACLMAGADRSAWSEFWEPDSGGSLGARPQSWTGLAAVVALEGAGRPSP